METAPQQTPHPNIKQLVAVVAGWWVPHIWCGSKFEQARKVSTFSPQVRTRVSPQPARSNRAAGAPHGRSTQSNKPVTQQKKKAHQPHRGYMGRLAGNEGRTPPPHHSTTEEKNSVPLEDMRKTGRGGAPTSHWVLGIAKQPCTLHHSTHRNESKKSPVKNIFLMASMKTKCVPRDTHFFVSQCCCAPWSCLSFRRGNLWEHHQSPWQPQAALAVLAIGVPYGRGLLWRLVPLRVVLKESLGHRPTSHTEPDQIPRVPTSHLRLRSKTFTKRESRHATLPNSNFLGGANAHSTLTPRPSAPVLIQYCQKALFLKAGWHLGTRMPT